MSTAAVIRSRENLVLKHVGAVQAGKVPEAILLEGDRLIEDARGAALRFETVLVAEERELRACELEEAGLPVRRVDAGVLGKLSSLKTSPGILAVCARPERKVLEDLSLTTDALALVVAGISDPGNLGALARSAEASGCAFFALVDGSCSPWNSKALRGSMGSLLRLPVLNFATAGDAVEALTMHCFRQVSAATRGGSPLANFDWDGRVALWIGAESGVLPDAAGETEHVTIPMSGQVESLNVTVAASLLLFAAGRAGAGSA